MTMTIASSPRFLFLSATMDTPAMIDYLGELLGSGPGVDSMVGEFNRRRGRISMPG